MKKHLLSLAVVVVVLTVAWTVYAAEGDAKRTRGGGGAGIGGMSEEQRKQMRDRYQNMSDEEKQKFREQMRARFENMSAEDRAKMRQGRGGRTRFSSEDQLKAIAEMEKQLAKLKAVVASSSMGRGAISSDMSDEEKAKLREKFAKSRTDRSSSLAAIRAELEKFGPARSRPMSLQMGSLRELRAISGLAEKEKAEETKKRIDALIEKQMKQVSPGGRPPRRAGESTRQYEERTTRRPPREGASTRRPRRGGTDGESDTTSDEKK